LTVGFVKARIGDVQLKLVNLQASCCHRHSRKEDDLAPR
jgi:hypothetical protein